MPFKILVTGAAGFIGYHLTKRLLDDGHFVVGIDNLNSYYDVNLKKDRISLLYKYKSFTFHKLDLMDLQPIVKSILSIKKWDKVFHLVAHAGIRYSTEDPDAFVESNVVGFHNLIRTISTKHFIYVSSASVYDSKNETPISENGNTGSPESMYAASKRCNELFASVYHHLYRLPITGLRYSVVYGPWGRPDMVMYQWMDCIKSGKPINVYGFGKPVRDFTFVDDTVEATILVSDRKNLETEPNKIYNVSSCHPVVLSDLVDIFRNSFPELKVNLLPLQPGEKWTMWSDSSELFKDTGYQPSTDIRVGTKKFIDWYEMYTNGGCDESQYNNSRVELTQGG